MIITTNLVFSEWERIFKDPMTTLAALDRVIHHSVVLDMTGVESYRAQQAQQDQAQQQEQVREKTRRKEAKEKEKGKDQD